MNGWEAMGAPPRPLALVRLLFADAGFALAGEIGRERAIPSASVPAVPGCVLNTVTAYKRDAVLSCIPTNQHLKRRGTGAKIACKREPDTVRGNVPFLRIVGLVVPGFRRVS